MSSYLGTKHGVEDPRQGLRLLRWEYEDFCAVRREDMAGVTVLHGEAHYSDRPKARRQYPGCPGADCNWDSYRGRGESHCMDQQSVNGHYGGFQKEDTQYEDCRRANSAWEGKNRDTGSRNYRVYEEENIRYRDCSSEIREGQYREDRVPGPCREGRRQYGKDRDLGDYREGRRQYQEDRDPRYYSEEERRGEKEGWHRQEKGSGEYREGRRQYREVGGKGEKWNREDGNSGARREQGRQYVCLKDQEDFKQHRQPRDHVVDRSSLDRGWEDHEFAIWSSGDGRASLGSDTCSTKSKMQGTDYNGYGELEGAAPGPRMPAGGSDQAECSRVRTGRSDWSQVWEQEADEANRVGSVLQRNSFYRRTAPSALRHSEFVQTRKEKQGTWGNAGHLPWVCLCPALVLGQHQVLHRPMASTARLWWEAPGAC